MDKMTDEQMEAMAPGEYTAWEKRVWRRGYETALAQQPAAVDGAMQRYKKLRDHVGGCTDGGCVVKRPTGMHTNGGCKCPQDKIKAQRMMYAGQALYDALAAQPGGSDNDQ